MALALAAIGRDRPGIVAGVAKVLFELGCNVEDSSMTLLRGNFAMMLVVACPDGLDPVAVEARLRPVCEEMGLTFSVLEVDDRRGVPRPTHVLTVYGADKPGILFRTCELLANESINITDLDSRLVGDADALYAVLFELEVPDTADVSELDRRLQQLASEVGVDVVLNDRDADVL
jgi:glycine cleavage system transcriptional repressor